ncbi:Uu.00g103370.m01.CDS01 [Anthostomella pinea]|uniref:Uu.00g103370.m01.CDS01 n=1 Tax=Anthostomella pinea TaxID=933095 RepID=A0AAI8VE22_9PEZI|nr:Uu.00g103370.m01.CDS01 [Anthostomella pinea]
METLETVQARHRKEQRDLQSRVTNKKKNATKKTRKGVNDECAELESQLKERQEQEIAALSGHVDDAQEADRTDAAAEEAQAEPDGARSPQANDAAATTNGITQQLKDTQIAPSGSATPSIPSPSESEPPTQGKKRNRQKDRLARRAAEQEAAAAAAEQEATGMTDHRKIEKKYLHAEFEAHGLVEKDIEPDGHCLFAAVADQLSQRGIPLVSASNIDTKGVPRYRIVRRAATDYMLAHADDFAPFLDGGEDLEGYTSKIRDTAEWGGHLELMALARRYAVEIKVLQDGRTETIAPDEGSKGDADAKKKMKMEGEGDEKRIWLAYYRHGYGLGEHYNSLRKAR